MTRYLAISANVFERFPGYLRGLVVGSGFTNGDTPQELSAAIDEAQQSIRESTGDQRVEARLTAWRDAFKLLGMRASDFRPSVDALIRRVMRGDSLPRISKIVDIGTLVTLRHIVPVGAHALDDVVGRLELRPAFGNERFIPFGGESEEAIPPGEIIYAEELRVATRRWTWRQGRHTLVLPMTRSAEYNIDALPPVGFSDVERISDEVAELGARFCGGNWSKFMLSSANREVEIPT